MCPTDLLVIKAEGQKIRKNQSFTVSYIVTNKNSWSYRIEKSFNFQQIKRIPSDTSNYPLKRSIADIYWTGFSCIGSPIFLNRWKLSWSSSRREFYWQKISWQRFPCAFLQGWRRLQDEDETAEGMEKKKMLQVTSSALRGICGSLRLARCRVKIATGNFFFSSLFRYSSKQMVWHRISEFDEWRDNSIPIELWLTSS